jgi:antimicrobial peptide system SdpA family protein
VTLAPYRGVATAATSTRTEEDQALGRQVLWGLALASLAVVYVLHAALPQNAVALPFENPRGIQQIVPEGWAFFTRSPRTVYPIVYRRGDDGRWRLWSRKTLATPDQLMGLDRTQRSEGTVMALILDQVSAQKWSNCTQDPAVCLSRQSAPLTLSNPSSHREICGMNGFVMQEVLPWAWRSSGTVMPSRVLAARVMC